MDYLKYLFYIGGLYVHLCLLQVSLQKCLHPVQLEIVVLCLDYKMHHKLLLYQENLQLFLHIVAYTICEFFTLHALSNVLRSYHSHIISDLGSVLFEQPFIDLLPYSPKG